MRLKRILTAAALVVCMAAQNICAVSADIIVNWVSESDKHITDEAGLRKLSQLVNNGVTFENEVIYLEADIDMSDEAFTPIGTVDHPFKGTFEGNDHKINGLKLRNIDNVDLYGLFGAVYEGGICDVKLTGVDIDISKEPQTEGNAIIVGSVVGYMCAGSCLCCFVDSGSIKTVGNAETAYYNYSTGGVCGFAKNSTIKFCRNNTAITSNGQCGGVAGLMQVDGGTCEMSYCCNNGDLTNTGEKAYTGGIAGSLTGGSIYACYNSGKVTAAENCASGIIVSSNMAGTSVTNCIDLCSTNINYTLNFNSEFKVMYANTDTEYKVRSFNVSDGDVKLEVIDTQNLTEQEILEKVNSYESNYVWSVNYGQPVLWWQATKGDAIIRGDVSGDGYLAPRDAALVLKHIDGAALLTGIKLECADYNADGSVDMKDVLLIMQSTRYLEYLTT